MLSNLDKYDIILASRSPRRRKLLKELGVKFNSTSIAIEENFPENLSPEEVAVYLAILKAKAYPNMNDQTLLITADTVVAVKNEILGKPVDKRDAFNILKRLSGKRHKVITGVCLMSFEKKIEISATTEVCFSILEDKEINYYIDRYKPYDKAGSYGIQEWIGYIGINKIEGSFYNVMGLPIHKLYQELKKF